MNQSTGTAKSSTAADVQEAFERGVLRGEEDANERNYWRRKYQALNASGEAQR